MAKFFIPDYYTDDLLKVDWIQLRERGIRHVFLDVDNTLEEHGAKKAGRRTEEVCRSLEDAGLSFAILSNAKRERAEEFCAPFNLPYVGQAAKPLTYQVKRYLKTHRLRPREVLLVGDQIFTDLWCARFLGAPALLVERLGGEEKGFLRFKRYLEKILCIFGQDPAKAETAPRI